MITLRNSLGFYVWFPGHFPKLVQPLAFWTSGFKYCQIRFKSCVEAWWVHHCPQFKKHYRGHDIATKKVALIPHFIKGNAVVCVTPNAPAPPAPGPRAGNALISSALTVYFQGWVVQNQMSSLFQILLSDLALNFPETRCQCLNNILEDPKRRNYSSCFIHIKSEIKGEKSTKKPEYLDYVLPDSRNLERILPCFGKLRSEVSFLFNYRSSLPLLVISAS